MWQLSLVHLSLFTQDTMEAKEWIQWWSLLGWIRRHCFAGSTMRDKTRFGPKGPGTTRTCEAVIRVSWSWICGFCESSAGKFPVGPFLHMEAAIHSGSWALARTHKCHHLTKWCVLLSYDHTKNFVSFSAPVPSLWFFLIFRVFWTSCPSSTESELWMTGKISFLRYT